MKASMRHWAALGLGIAAMSVLLSAQQPAPGDPPRQGAGRGQGRGAGGFTAPPANPAVLLFTETWASPMAQPMVQASISNTALTLHIYGDANEIRKTTHDGAGELYTYTGETTTNWALTLSDPKNYWDLTGDGRIRLQTRNSGFRSTHVVIKTADGRYFASEEGNPESTAWIARDYIFRDLTWRLLLMTDTPSNASNRRQPNPKRVPIIPLQRATPDLTKVEEVGYSDLMEGGWIPSTSRMRAWEVWGKAVPR